MTHKPLSRAKIRQLSDFAARVESGTSKATPAQVVQKIVRPLLEEAVWQQDRWDGVQQSWQAACERVESQEQEIRDLRERIAQLQDELFHARNDGGA